MSDEIMIEGVDYLSSKRAAQSSGYAQDYIGQLARAGLIDARRIGNLWYISMDSLGVYKANAAAYVPEPPKRNIGQNPDTFLSFDGKDYVSASRAADITGYHQDYIGQLARSGSVLSRRVGNHWYVQRAGIMSHKKEKDALLGAVQAQSVGIPRTADREDDLGYNGGGPYLNYTSDERELLPVVVAGEANSAPKRENHHEIGDEIASDTQYNIPIRIFKDKGSYSKGISATPRTHGYRSEEKQTHKAKISPNNLVILGFAATIVIFLSVGFLSLKNTSVYAQFKEKGRNMVLSASAAEAITRIGDILERFFSQELVYQRSTN